RPFVALRRAGSGDLGPRTKTFVHVAAQFAQGVLIEMRASRLEDRGAVPIEPEPRQLVELALGHARAYARDVDVLDAHCVCAVCLSCPQPGEQRSARIPQMQLARGARSESSALVHRLTAHIAQEKHEYG